MEKLPPPKNLYWDPCFFNVLINELKFHVGSEMAMFADDIKLFRVIKTKRYHEELKKKLSKLSEWVVKWQTYFHVNRYKVMHVEVIDR